MKVVKVKIKDGKSDETKSLIFMLISLSVSILFLIFCLVMRSVSNVTAKETRADVLPSSKLISNGVSQKDLISKYFNSFLNKDFKYCDECVNNKSDKLDVYKEWGSQTEVGNACYEGMLKKMSESIVAVSITKAGNKTYSVKVEYKLVENKAEDNLVFDRTDYKKICEKYLTDNVDKDKFHQLQIKNMVSWFNANIEFSDKTNIVTKTVYADKEVNGVGEIYNEIIRSGGLKNYVGVFESAVQKVLQEEANNI